jgi:hypothetical protein
MKLFINIKLELLINNMTAQIKKIISIKKKNFGPADNMRSPHHWKPPFFLDKITDK